MPHCLVEGHTGSCGGSGFGGTRSDEAFCWRYARFGERGSAGKARTQANVDDNTTMSTADKAKLDVLYVSISRTTATAHNHQISDRQLKEIELTEDFETHVGTLVRSSHGGSRRVPHLRRSRKYPTR